MDLTSMTDDALDALRIAVLVEQERRRLVASAPALVAAVTAQYTEATKTAAPAPWASLTDRVAPGQRVIWTDGQTWRNTSGAWLPTTATPATWPQGWAQETGLPPTVTDTQGDEWPAWSPDATYIAGDRVTHVGRAWECLLGHGPERQGTWPPGAAHTVWTNLGPA